MSVIPRRIANSVLQLKDQYPILALTGPRQSGKTTLLRYLLPDYQYVSLENLDNRTFAQEDAVGFLETYSEPTIFDEVQRVPSLFSYLQTKVDSRRAMGQYILSGSQNFHLLERITQSLAGRVAILKLLPFDTEELRQAQILDTQWQAHLLKGFYPPVFDRQLNPSEFYNNYLQTYINRDVATLSNIQNARRFQNFIRLCAARTGQLLNLSNLANECGITQPTAKSWLSILERSYIIFLLQPYFENFSKRVMKTPKLYFYDVGLAAFLLGSRYKAENPLPSDLSRSTQGHLFENLVIADMVKKNHHDYSLRDLWFWRDSSGNEVDILTQAGEQLDAFEIKSTQTILPKLFNNLNKLDQITSGRLRRKTVIYAGTERQQRSNNFTVQPWDQVELK